MSNTIKSAELANAVYVIKDAVLRSQQRALSTINQELLALYYGIGRFVSVNTRNKNWGEWIYRDSQRTNPQRIARIARFFCY